MILHNVVVYTHYRCAENNAEKQDGDGMERKKKRGNGDGLVHCFCAALRAGSVRHCGARWRLAQGPSLLAGFLAP